MSSTIIEGHYTAAADTRIAIVAARFNSLIVDQLVLGAIDTLQRHGLKENQHQLIRVPGAFELPLVIQQVAQSQQYSGIIALGAVIRGATPHFDYVAGQCATGIAQIMLQTNTPIAFGVLTTDNIEQAIERAGTKAGNKGSDAALSLLEMISLLQQLGHEHGK